MTVPPIQGSPAGGKIKSQDEILRDTWNGIVKLCETNQPMDAEQIIRNALSYDQNVKIHIARSLGTNPAKVALDIITDQLAAKGISTEYADKNPGVSEDVLYESRKKNLLSVLKYLVKKIEEGSAKDDPTIKESFVRAKKVLRIGWPEMRAKAVFGAKIRNVVKSIKNRAISIFKDSKIATIFRDIIEQQKIKSVFRQNPAIQTLSARLNAVATESGKPSEYENLTKLLGMEKEAPSKVWQRVAEILKEDETKPSSPESALLRIYQNGEQLQMSDMLEIVTTIHNQKTPDEAKGFSDVKGPAILDTLKNKHTGLTTIKGFYPALKNFVALELQKVEVEVQKKVDSQEKDVDSAILSLKDISKEGGLVSAADKEVSLVSFSGDPLSTSVWELKMRQLVLRKLVKAGYTSASSVSSLVDKIGKRSWSDALKFQVGREGITCSGYAYTEQEHLEDKRELEALLAEHNGSFENRILLFNPDTEGLLEKAEIQEGGELYVRADLHSDVASLLVQLKMLQGQGKLDKDFKCKPEFHMVFLGDYMDRGLNDIEVMSILLKLRIENPDQVHLIRGNHEDVQHSQDYGVEGAWMFEHRQEFEDCYKTFPLAFFVGSRRKPGESGVQEFFHFSHGTFSTLVDPIAFLDGADTIAPVDRFFIESSPTRMRSLTKKQAEAEEILAQARKVEGQSVEKGKRAERYNVGDVVGSSSEGEVTTSRAGRPAFTPKVLQALSRFGSGTSRIKAFMRGHSHEAEEYSVPRKKGGEKVIETTLPTGTIGAAWKEGMKQQSQSSGQEEQPLQGVLLKIGKRMRDWKKTPAILSGEGKEAALTFGTEVGAYDKVSLKGKTV